MCDPTQRRRWPTDETITCLYALRVCDLINSKARERSLIKIFVEMMAIQFFPIILFLVFGTLN